MAGRGSSDPTKMVHLKNSFTKNASSKALKQISSYHMIREKIKAGIMQIMAAKMFAQTIFNEPINSQKASVAVLANKL